MSQSATSHPRAPAIFFTDTVDNARDRVSALSRSCRRENWQCGKPLIRSPRRRVQRKADRHVEAERLGRFGLGASWYLVGR
jgi:hypothetical protein